MARLGILSFAAIGGFAGGCKAQEKEASTSSEPVQPEAQPEATSASAPEPVPAPQPATPVSATEAERELAKAFIERFLAVIEANDQESWPSMHTKARREALVANDAVEKSFQAWHKGTLTAVGKIREADFSLQRVGDRFKLTFLGVRVPTDPDTEYSMSVAIEDGQMLISEK